MCSSLDTEKKNIPNTTKKRHRVSICSSCAKVFSCKCKHSKCKQSRYLVTSAGNWASIEEKFSHKIMGRFRLLMYIRKVNERLKQYEE